MLGNDIIWLLFRLLDPVDQLLRWWTYNVRARWALLLRTDKWRFHFVRGIQEKVTRNNHGSGIFEPIYHFVGHGLHELVSRLVVQLASVGIRGLSDSILYILYVVTKHSLLPTFVLEVPLQELGEFNEVMLFERVEATFEDVTCEGILIFKIEQVEPIVWVLLNFTNALENIRNI